MITYPLVMFGTYVFEKPQNFAISSDSRIQEVEIPRRHGSILVAPIVLKSRVITITETLVADTSAALQTKFDNFKAQLESGTQPLYLNSNRYIYCNKTGFSTDYVRGTSARVANCAVTFLAVDPFVYGTDAYTDTEHVIANGQSYSIFYTAPAPFKPKFTLRNISTGTIYSLRITNGTSFCQVTTLSAGETWVIDSLTETVTKNGVDAMEFFSGSFLQVANSDTTLSLTISPGTVDLYLDTEFRNTYYDV